MNRTDIRDIIVNDAGKRVLDTPEKIARWITYKFEEQEISKLADPSRPSIKIIDLSLCEISTDQKDGNLKLTNLCDIADKIDCIRKSSESRGKGKFHQEVFEELYINNSIVHAPFFQWTKFHKKVRIQDSEILGGGSFSYSNFEEGLFLQNSTFDSFQFDNSVFGDQVYMHNLIINGFQVHLNKCTFNDEVSISNIELKTQYPPELTHIYIIFNNSVFKSHFKFKHTFLSRHCAFQDCHFEGRVEFISIDAGTLVFSGSEFKNDFLISTNDWRVNMIDNFHCNHVKINSRFDVSMTNVKVFDCKFSEVKTEGIFRIFASIINYLDMTSLCNRGILFFEQNNIYSQIKILTEGNQLTKDELQNRVSELKNSENGIASLTFQNAISPGIIEIENSPVTSITNRKTARLLKDSAYKTNNIIDTLKFKAQEMELYKKETKEFPIKFLLFVNKCSNKYGLSWVRGIIFTLLSTLIFFWLINYLGTTERIFYITGRFDCTEFGAILKSYLNLLNILNLKNGSMGFQLNAFGEIMFLLSQIVIAYGIYQTVSAFRKYGKMN